MAFISITVTSRSRLIRSSSLNVEERLVARKPALFYESIRDAAERDKDIAERYRFSCIRDGRWLPLGVCR